MCKKSVILTLFVFVLAGAAQAAVTLPAIISDNMVLQQGTSVPIWGTANSGEQVTVDFDGQSKLTTADGNGDWMVTLNSMSASVAGADMVITGDNSITITDVWVGEVWLSSGQSNMNMSLGGGTYDSDEAEADMINHNIRRYKVDNAAWVVLTPSNGNQASAVHYFYAHELAHNLGNTAGGMIETSVSGSGIEEWTHANGAGLLYETRVNPLQPFAIKGAIWYQGETDFNWKSEFYYDRMVGLIAEWRGDWGQGDFPFGIVQLPWKQTNRVLWPVVQDSQLRAHLDVANTGLAVTWDLDPKGKGVHPYTKKPIGERLALWARSQVYGQTGFAYSSPIRNAQTSYINGSEIVITFDHIDGSLITNGGGDPFPFSIAGSDGTYYEDATGQIVGNTVVVSSPSVPNPESVRFVWDIEQGDLFDTAGLPAAVFELNLAGGSSCGDATCDPGEDQCNCAADCGTPPSTETNCTDGIDEDCDGNTDCNDADCNGDPACPSCGDATCDPGEDQCNCPADCGTPPSTETNCNDGSDEDCDGLMDCEDPDCDTDPICQSACNDNGICEPGEDCNNCSGDCDSKTNGQPSGRYCCGDGEQTGPEGDGRCDGNY